MEVQNEEIEMAASEVMVTVVVKDFVYGVILCKDEEDRKCRTTLI